MSLGMRAYSTDLKDRLVRAVANGQPMREVARRFHVAVNTVKRAVVQERETGSLERKPIPGCPRRIGPEQEAIRRERLPAAPQATVLEHCAWWAERQGQPLREATRWRRQASWSPSPRVCASCWRSGRVTPRSSIALVRCWSAWATASSCADWRR